MHKVWILFIYAMLVGLGMNLAHPITPAHLRTIEVSSNMFGVIFASMNLGQFIMAPVWGNLGDSKNRKAVLIIGLIGYGVSQALFGYFTNIYLIILVRFSAGVFASAIISNVLAHISISKDYENHKGKIISLFVAFNVIGSTLGYYVGGFLGNLFTGQESIMMYIQAVFNVILALFTFVFIQMIETDKVLSKRQSALKQLSQIRKLSKPLFLLVVMIAVISIAQTNFSKYLDLYMTDIGYKSSDIGTLVFVTGIITLIMSFLVVPRLYNRFKDTHILVVSVFLQAVFSVLTFTFDQGYFLLYGYSFYLVYIAGKAIYEPTVTYHLSKYKDVSPGILMGSRTSAIALGAIIGPLLAGLIYDDIGHYLFMILSLLLLLSGVVLYYYQRSVKL